MEALRAGTTSPLEADFHELRQGFSPPTSSHRLPRAGLEYSFAISLEQKTLGHSAQCFLVIRITFGVNPSLSTRKPSGLTNGVRFSGLSRTKAGLQPADLITRTSPRRARIFLCFNAIISQIKLAGVNLLTQRGTNG
jgi:hypothetical protein